MQEFLCATGYIDSDHTAVQAYATRHSAGKTGDRQQAVSLYYAVRDEIRYNPYSLDLSVRGMRASSVLEHGEGWCVNKAILLAACCRYLGIPARLGFADVINHLTTAKLREKMGSDVFKWHGYTEIWLAGRWVKATPAFNIALCEKAGLQPLEFDGIHDSIYHEFDKAGNKHMEYQHYRGEYADLPIEAIAATFECEYNFTQSQAALATEDSENLHDAVAQERSS